MLQKKIASPGKGILGELIRIATLQAAFMRRWGFGAARRCSPMAVGASTE
jgi:hypothetical protein